MDHKDEGTHSNKCKLGHEGIIRNMKEYSQEGIESAYQSNILFRFHNSSASFSNSCMQVDINRYIILDGPLDTIIFTT